MSVWLAAGTAMCGGVALCALGCLRTGAAGAVVALQTAGTVASLALIVLAAAFRRQPFADLGLVLAVLSWAGTLCFLRYLEREP
jgi:multisubunit Na+/H+ antiporter MnhF subunit